MIAPKYEFGVFAFVMSLIMSGVISFAMLTFELGITPDVLVNWPQMWAKSLLVAFPTSLVVVPYAKKWVGSMVLRPR